MTPTDRRNGALMRKDARLVRLLKAFAAVADYQGEAFVDVAVAAWGMYESRLLGIRRDSDNQRQE